MQVSLEGHLFSFLPERALFKHDESLLVIADVHLGKASHFRKHGISIPAASQAEDYTKLRRLLDKTKPEKVYFLGDLFHSSLNSDWHAFAALVESYPNLCFTLIKGNHDIIDYKFFDKLCIDVSDKELTEGPFVYSHEPLQSVDSNRLNIAGHIHPGILLRGMGKQSLRLPCFHLSGNTLLLPAFGTLTGLYMMDMDQHNKVYAVLPGEVKKLN